MDEADAVAALGFLHVMRGEDHGQSLAVAEVDEILEEVAARAGIEPGRRLVEQHEIGLVQQSLGELDPTREAAGEALDVVGRALGETEAVEQRRARARCSRPRRGHREPHGSAGSRAP